MPTLLLSPKHLCQWEATLLELQSPECSDAPTATRSKSFGEGNTSLQIPKIPIAHEMTKKPSGTHKFKLLICAQLLDVKKITLIS